MIRLYPIAPCPAPRQVNADRWKPSPRVRRYHAFCDEVKLRKVEIPSNGHHIVFALEMPKSWPESKKTLHEGAPHRQTPDRDNMEKALLDAVYGQDSHIWTGTTTKLWGRHSYIIVADHLLPLTHGRQDRPLLRIDSAYQACMRGGYPFATLSPNDFKYEDRTPVGMTT